MYEYYLLPGWYRNCEDKPTHWNGRAPLTVQRQAIRDLFPGSLDLSELNQVFVSKVRL